jgi:hypothetical protein
MLAGTSTTNRTGASESTGSPAPSLITGGGVSRSCANARVAQAPLPMPDDGAAVPVSISIRPLTRLACGITASHYPDVVSPSYAALLGTFVVYPLMLAIWCYLHRPGGNSR